jgi:DNA polymerase
VNRVVHIDFESYSEADLRKLGPWGYSLSPSTEVLCMAWAINDGKPHLWKPGEPLPAFVKDPTGYELHAWNSFFEYCLWHHTQGWLAVPVAQWVDPSAQAAALALPRSLAGCGAALGLPQDQQKNKRGRYLIQRLCVPYRGKRTQDALLMEELYAYCQQDVIAERAIERQLRPLTRTERAVWELDQAINIRGIGVDTAAVDDALVLLEQVSADLESEVSEITDGALTNVRQRQVVMDWCAGQGCALQSFDKNFLKRALAVDGIPPNVRRVIEIRLQLGKTSTAKYAALKALAADDGRAHGLLRYHGASTGRWSGQLVQPQNFVRSAFADVDTCIDLIRHRDAHLLRAVYDDPMEALSSSLRGMLRAAPGRRLLVADYSAIEARVLAWLAGQTDVLDVFRGHGKIYEHTASRLYGIPIETVTKEQRFVGKVATLALGYQGGANAFMRMAEVYGVEIDEPRANRIKRDWRAANLRITGFWYAVETDAMNAVTGAGEPPNTSAVAFRKIGDSLFCRLPSGRCLAYREPLIKPGKYGDQLTFMGVESVSRKWMRRATYGGSLVESATQGVARDLLAEAMLRLDKAGYPIVLSVHDELIAEREKSEGSLDEFISIMTELPTWAKGLPIDAEGFECDRYRK